ncbi:FHA domain-containing protein [Lujinxingia vulgaris]|uniref:FHA domain-containing protein n=1 Tax=Lujinxingia vulgaris TaxID=2600176 RepID=A0A5C6XT77_9DELT|nr:FHA domain-containing protein [Lujinxingia vulgaris]
MSLVATSLAGHSKETADVKSEEGGDDVKSSWPLCPGLHTFQQRGPGGPPPPPPRPNAGGGWPQEAPQAPRPPQAPQAQPSFGAEPAYGAATLPPLYLSFNNNRYTVDKEKFVIGRGSQHTDLTIRDGNISRKHCMVIHRNGSYYIKDLGSTNGIEFRGNRIESKKIEEGDVFFLCDYELRFSYRG